VTNRPYFILALLGAWSGVVEAKTLPPLTDRYLAWVAKGSLPAIASAKREMRRRDAGDAEDLGDALGRAMQVAPLRVLPLVNSGPGFEANWLCTPLISEDVSTARAKAILRRSRVSIERVRDRKLSRQRAICLKDIQEGEANLAKAN
jgi:hypothetical protein